VNEILDIKAQARAMCRAARKEAHADVDAGEEALEHLQNMLDSLCGRVLAGYMPIHSEIDPRPAMSAFNGPVCVPVIEAAGRPLQFREWTSKSAMEPGELGAQVPTEGAFLTPQVLIVPLLGFDARGYRLGYGGGFYDRTLERLRRLGPVTAIGFAYAAQEMDEVPVEETDEPLDMIVTDRGVLFAQS
jgi:5-formyltetrahydrofolate cyclo-ligase